MCKMLEKVKKPWYVPGFIWNAAVYKMCDAAKKLCKIETASDYAAGRSMDLLETAVANKDPEKRAKVCRIVASSSAVIDKASVALNDGIVTDDEKAEVGACVKALVDSVVTQADIDGFIDDCQSALLV